MQFKLEIKPLSVNEAWRGRRFKTDKYNAFQSSMLLILPNVEIKSFKRLKLTFGMSNTLSDIDNPVKMTVDCLQKKYSINDRDLIYLELHKVKTKKGSEFIEVEFLE
jgi:Holliday junction resolvase RusA-like endonuclease